MNLTISGHHLEVTPALREYVLTKLDRATRHFDQVVDQGARVVLGGEHQFARRERDRDCQCPGHELPGRSCTQVGGQRNGD